MEESTVNLWQILAALRAKKVPFVLTGAHGIAPWTGRPRATYDVDILCKAGRNQQRAMKALAPKFTRSMIGRNIVTMASQNEKK